MALADSIKPGPLGESVRLTPVPILIIGGEFEPGWDVLAGVLMGVGELVGLSVAIGVSTALVG